MWVMIAKGKTAVLFVEDNKLAQKIGIIILEQYNCRVDAVSSGEAALVLASKIPYNIIFMYIGLPDMDGLSVIKEIKKIKLNKHVPIIALTAHSDQDYIAQSYEMGASEFLVKPLSDQIAKNILEKYSHYGDLDLAENGN
jgi:two-component system aerobic respiration control sensor histidine kinase ArcB